MLKNIIRIVAFAALLLIPAAQASTVYDQVFVSPSTIKCNSDISCSILDHIRVQTLTYTGNPGTAVYTWTATCASAPDAVFYIRPTGAVTGCFQMDGFATSSVPLTNALTSAHILVGNASNIATDSAVTGDVAITNAGATTVNTVLGGSTPVTTTRTVSAAGCLTGGGDLSANRTITLTAPLSIACGGSGSTTGVIYQSVSTIAALSALASPSTVIHANVIGYLSGSTLGGGQFDYSSAALTDNSCTIFPASDGKHWVREGALTDATQCGAVPDGSTNSTSAIQAGLTLLTAQSNGALTLPGGTGCYVISNAAAAPILTISGPVTLQGQGNACISATASVSGATGIALTGTSPALKNITMTNWTIGGGSAVGCSGTVTNPEISGLVLTGNGSTTSTAINLNCTTMNNFRIHDNVISGANYGILVGSTVTGSGLYVSHNYLLNNTGDAIELNTNAGFCHSVIDGNIIDTSSGTPVAGKQFGLGMSNGCDVTYSNNQQFGNNCQTGSGNGYPLDIESSSHDILIQSNLIVMSCDNNLFNFPSATQLVRVKISNNVFVATSGATSGTIKNSAGAAMTDIEYTGNRFENWGTVDIWGGNTFKQNKIIGGAGAGTTAITIKSGVGTTAISDNTIETTYASLYDAPGAADVGYTILTGSTIPTSFFSGASGAGPEQIQGLTISGSLTLSGTSSPEYHQILPAAQRYIGTTSLLVANSGASRRASSVAMHTYDGTTDTTPFVAGTSGGSPTVNMNVGRNASYSAPFVTFNNASCSAGVGTCWGITSANADAITYTVDFKGTIIAR